MGEHMITGWLMNTEEKEKILDLLGDPSEVTSGLAAFRDLAIRMNMEHSELLRLYPDRWVAMSKDGVVASADTIDDLFRKVDELQIPRHEVVHDYMDSNPRSLIL